MPDTSGTPGTPGLKTVIYPVHDLAQAKSLLTTALGTEPTIDQPYYVQFDLPNGELIGLDPNGHQKGLTGPTPFFVVPDLEQRLQSLLAAGAKPLQEIQDVGGGTRIASVQDPDGNTIGLISPA